LVAGSTLLVLSVVGAIVLRGQSQPGSTPTLTTPPATTSPVPAPPAAFAVSSADVSALGPFSTTVTWQTTAASSGRVTWGPTGMRPLLWAESPRQGLVHQVVLTGLSSSTPYVVSIDARSESGDVASERLPFTTAAAPLNAVGTTGAGAVRVGGAPFFPLITLQECPSQWTPDIADGINLFAGNTCTGLSSLLTAVQGRALAAGTSDDTPIDSGPGLLGWFYPDEADARGLTGVSLARPGNGLRFLTLTAHFFPGAAPLPTGRGMYPGLVAKADVVGFDLYPLQELCRRELLPWVFDAQQELVRITQGKPTFQWIEIREMKCPNATAAVTARTIRVESWLAIAGGAHGLGFFPSDWGSNVGTVVRSIAARIKQLEPALLRPASPVGVTPVDPTVRASARELGGAIYVIAVNAGTRIANVRLEAPEPRDRFLEITGGHWLPAARGAFDVALPPMSVRIYVAPPPGAG
jgi:hypothetical protein